jgi:hypothetical protein
VGGQVGEGQGLDEKLRGVRDWLASAAAGAAEAPSAASAPAGGGERGFSTPLPRYRYRSPFDTSVTEYYAVGHDDPRSALLGPLEKRQQSASGAGGAWYKAPVEGTSIDLLAMPAGERSFACLFGGCGDGRSVRVSSGAW